MKDKKIIALALIYLVITIAFGLYTPEKVEAQTQGCCELTEVEDFCRYTTSDKCDSAKLFAPNAFCDNTGFCALGCCADNTDGSCHTGVSKATCLSKDATWLSDPTCSTVQQCNLGCCSIGDQCSLTTELQCKSAASQYPGVQMQFDPGISSEAECVEKCLGADKGACVSDRACTFTSRDQCSGTFHVNMLCSHSSLSTDCAKQQTTGCYNGDVYWFDSCGNPENIYSSNKQISYNNGFVLSENSYSIANPNDKENGNCDYVTGTLCGEVQKTKPTYGDYICRDLNCYDVFENSFSPNSGGDKSHGESWCVFENKYVGPTKDTAGSRHYLSQCLNGEEVMVPCKDQREEICLQNKVGAKQSSQEQTSPVNTILDKENYVEASCVENKYETCSSVGNAEDCNHYSKTCYWLGTVAIPGRTGFCLPLIPPGNKDNCAGTYVCKAKVRRAADPLAAVGLKEKKYKCIENCQCLEHPKSERTIDDHDVSHAWVQTMNAICRAQGDCGAWFNVDGKSTLGGYSVPKRTGGYRLTQNDITKWTNLLDKDPDFDDWLEGKYWSSLLLNLPNWGFNAYWSLATIGGVIGVSAWWMAATTGKEFAYFAWKSWDIKTGYTLSKLGWAARIASIALLTYTSLYFLDQFEVIEKRTREIKFEFQCKPWQTPKTGDCESCMDGEELGFECSQYKCESLGKNCKYIEEDERVTCVKVSSKDVTAPIITPMPIEGFTFTTTHNGFKINEKIPAFTPVHLGIKTDEPATCRYSVNPNTDYEEMGDDFGLSNTYDHEAEFSIPAEFATEEGLALTNGGKFNLYIKCQDYSPNENINKIDYAISFEIDPGPDLNPPSIEQFSILPESMIPHQATEINLNIYLNEPATCKWSKQDQAYENMANSFDCAEDSSDSSSIYHTLYECGTTLTNIQQATQNTFYFRCKDQSENTMEQSYIYKLLSTIPLKISSVDPTGEVFTRNPVLKVRTDSGAENGIATCGYSAEETELENTIQMFNTESLESSQQLRMIPPGTYTFYFKCVDKAGNTDSAQTTFQVIAAEESFIYNVYKDRISQTLHISTTEEAECQYSNTKFTYGLGTPMASIGNTHTAPLGFSIYYITCQDKFNNQASITVAP